MCICLHCAANYLDFCGLRDQCANCRNFLPEPAGPDSGPVVLGVAATVGLLPGGGLGGTWNNYRRWPILCGSPEIVCDTRRGG